MTYSTHNEIAGLDITTVDSHLQGYITATYDQLIASFGEPKPTHEDQYKIDWHWQIVYANTVVATIYNWKNGPNYLGRRGDTKDDITEWNVGGHLPAALTQVAETLGAKHETQAAREAKWAAMYK